MKVSLSPLEARVANMLAQSRNVSVAALIADLLYEEAALEMVGWRRNPARELTSECNTTPTEAAQKAVSNAIAG